MNPFIISSYKSPEYFCNRTQEAKQLVNGVENGVNLVLSSLRRMGKTGLIKHVYHQLEKQEKYYLFYIDIDQTETLNDFMNKTANSLLKYPQKNFYDRFLEFLKHLRPVFTFNPLTGAPEVELRQEGNKQDEVSIESIFDYLEKLDRTVVIAFDEFQRITAYPETRTESFLRGHIQHLQNIRFIFSGSSRNLLQSMFNDHSRPFYQSAGFINLERLDKHVYTEFVHNHFDQTGISISVNDIESGIDWTNLHTFYSQYLFNAIWGSGNKKITRTDIEEIKEGIIVSRDVLYGNYRNLLTDNQYQLCRAIALENEVNQPNSMDFIRSHKLGSVSTVNSALKVLVEKELIYKESGSYKLYDVFQAHWFRRTT